MYKVTLHTCPYFYSIVDNLPCATKFELMETGDVQYEHGYRLGFVKDNVVSCY